MTATLHLLLTVEIQPVDYTIWDTAALTLLQRFLQVDTPIINRIVFFVMLQLFLYIFSLQPTPAIIYQRYCMYWQILCTAVIRNVVHYTTAHVFHRRHITLHYITFSPPITRSTVDCDISNYICFIVVLLLDIYNDLLYNDGCNCISSTCRTKQAK